MGAMLEARGSRRALVRAYSFYSYLYGRTAARLERQGVTEGLRRAAVRPDERVLEVAVGTAAAHARLRRRLSERGVLVGVDLAPGMLKATRRRMPQAVLVRADARALPFADASFDVLWSSYFLDLVPTAELTPVLAEFRRVLRPGGRVVLVNFSKQNERLLWWERLYRLTPTWLIPWVFCGCRPIQAELFVRAAGFGTVERSFVAPGFPSEILTAHK